MTSIKGAIQEIIGSDTDLIQGTVISVSPMKVQAAGDSKLIVSAMSLVVPSRLSLGLGDSVHMLVLNKGKKFYVLDRV